MSSVRFDMARATWRFFGDSTLYIGKSCVCRFSMSLVDVEGGRLGRLGGVVNATWGRSNTVSEDIGSFERRGDSPVKKESKDSLNVSLWESSLAIKTREREQCSFPFWKVSTRMNMMTKRDNV